MMNSALKEDLRSLLHLVSLAVVGAATIGVFFGLGFMWLTDPRPAALPEDPVISQQAQALEADAVLAPVTENVTPDASPVLPTEKVAASPIADPQLDGASVPIRSTAIASKPIRPRRVTQAKRVRLSRYRRQESVRYWAASWRPDASAGPNPGGGFYGPPNVNIGYINPR